MNILHINAYDIEGGAARAAYRIHRSIVDHGRAPNLNSRMRVIYKQSDDPTIVSGPLHHGRLWGSIHPRISRLAKRGFSTGNPTWHSYAWPDTGLGNELEQLHKQGQADIVHLHWLGNSTLSIEEIGHLTMPLVWSLHDQWAFCGAEHYTSPPRVGEAESSDKRYEIGYTKTSRPAHESGPDLNRRIWKRKNRAWRSPIHIVAPSNWMAECARSSALMNEWPITVIPYPINLETWSPFDQRQARTILKLPLDRPLILFGAVGGTADSRKGADLLLKSLQRLRSKVAGTSLEQLELVVFGQGSPVNPTQMGFPIHYSGRLHDDISLRLLYAAADVFVIPSRQDNLPNTGLEAQACGTPVVAFRTGGLVDIVDDRTTGALAEPFDPENMANALRWVLEDTNRWQQLRDAARRRAENLWNPRRICEMYQALYSTMLSKTDISNLIE